MRLLLKMLVWLQAVGEKPIVVPEVRPILPLYGGDRNSSVIRQMRSRSVPLLQKTMGNEMEQPHRFLFQGLIRGLSRCHGFPHFYNSPLLFYCIVQTGTITT